MFLAKSKKRIFLFILLFSYSRYFIETLSIGLIVPVMSIMQYSLEEIQNINYLKDILIYLKDLNYFWCKKPTINNFFIIFFWCLFF